MIKMFKISPKNFFILLSFWFNLNQILGDILIYKNSSTQVLVHKITSLQLVSDSSIPDAGLMGYIAITEPENACDYIKSTPNVYIKENYSLFALVDLNDCDFSDKLHNIMNSSFNGAIFYDPKLNHLSLDEKEGKSADFPVLLISSFDGQVIKSLYTFDKGYVANFTKGAVNLGEEVITIKVRPAILLILFSITVILIVFSIIFCILKKCVFNKKA